MVHWYWAIRTILVGLSLGQAAAQGIGSLPSCALPCATSAASAVGCSLADTGCLCEAPRFFSATLECARSFCPINDQSTASGALAELCVGVITTTTTTITSSSIPPSTTSHASSPPSASASPSSPISTGTTHIPSPPTTSALSPSVVPESSGTTTGIDPTSSPTISTTSNSPGTLTALVGPSSTSSEPTRTVVVFSTLVGPTPSGNGARRLAAGAGVGAGAFGVFGWFWMLFL